MDRERAARCLIIQYLESCASNEKEHLEELEVSIDCLKNLWNIEDPSIKLPGVKSIIDLIPDAKIDPERALQLKLEGNSALQSGNLDLAIQRYTDAIAADPTQGVFYCNRACAYQKKKEYNKAASDAEKAIELNPKDAKAYSRLGLALWSLNRPHEAREAYKRGLDACPGNASLLEGLDSISEGASAGEDVGSGADPLGGLGAMFANNPMFAGLAERFKDPQVLAMMQEPEMQDLIQQIKTNPANLMSMLGDPRMSRLMSVIMGGGMQK